MVSTTKWNVPTISERKRVTLHDVAEHVGVSKSTVSLVLQNSDSVSAATREKVLRGIDETGYVYNRKAAALRQTMPSDLIGIMVNGLNTPYSSEILNYCEKEALQRGIVPMFSSNAEQFSQQEKLVQIYMEYKVGGIILCPAPYTTASWLDKIWRSGFPLVQIMREVPFSQFPAVVADNRKGVYVATQHLIQLGHQKIAFLGGREDISDYHERLSGYKDAMNEAGLRVPSNYIFPIAQSRQAGRLALKSVLEYDASISAVVCFSDLMAYGVLSISRELGIKVGSDLAVVAFDDLPDSSITHPALTTVQVEASQFAAQAIDLLQVYMNKPQAKPERLLVPTRLMVRESCGANAFNH
ncbi:LacI family DNA-binding transcriptional regulator [Thiofilum flexile]|uniref:LacI family DNA-binding transcriptional regulator n=1 Tax=Thiofilum flexile TaxID=125627 RepID=UPI00037D9E6F|nr:LacI family DNA-binding transcriptional regulator [Thiofilum flexile]